MGYLQKDQVAVNAGSMADIAFLLLIFFLVTTTIVNDKGILMKLPIKNNESVELNQRNVFAILVNSKDEILAKNELIKFDQLKDRTKKFIDNNGANAHLSDSPLKAVVSIRTDRGTTYDTYLKVLDELKLSYNELRAASLGLRLAEYENLDIKNPEEKELLDQARELYPMQISDAEPLESK
ncbi:ExbD/TolR family protein [Chondrinema litorale]|uniref:ExbD/TolR family protein n=1 Tax=Chondrinema litorale TaxID=2994555 RepID=UPI0025427207|nr:biopolymer transporter ExbD [Chondrinema litorale]UZR96487.1 biopolymer transporter ExbD [Chondrinema litorale]